MGFRFDPLTQSAVEEFDTIYVRQCRQEGLIAAIQHVETGEVFSGDNHRIAYEKRRIKLPDEGGTLGESYEKGCPKRYHQGFIDQEGDFFTRDQIEKKFGFRYSETETGVDLECL